MTPPIIPRELVAKQLDVPARLLVLYESRGLIEPLREGDVEGYGVAEVRRAWSVVTYHRDLGINLAGIEALLKLRDHMAGIHRRLQALAIDLDEIAQVEDAASDAPDDGR